MRSQSLSGILGTAVVRVVLVVDIVSVDVVSILSDVEGEVAVVLVVGGDVNEVEALDEVISAE